MSLDDASLLVALRAGDEAAFVELVERYHGPMIRLARTMVPSQAVAEEVVQDTWLGVVKGIERFEGRSSVKTWLFRILANRARSTGVREHRSAPADPDVLADRFDAGGVWADPPAPWLDESESRIDAARLADQVRSCIDRLPPQQRQVVMLRDVEGLPAPEVCSVLAISDANQRVLLHRGRAHVRALLAEGMGRS